MNTCKLSYNNAKLQVIQERNQTTKANQHPTTLTNKHTHTITTNTLKLITEPTLAKDTPNPTLPISQGIIKQYDKHNVINHNPKLPNHCNTITEKSNTNNNASNVNKLEYFTQSTIHDYIKDLQNGITLLTNNNNLIPCIPLIRLLLTLLEKHLVVLE
jgi:hypothetical protein